MKTTIYILLLLIITSCNVSKKSKSVEITKTDSTEAKSSDSTQVKKDEKKDEKETNWEIVTVTEYDTIKVTVNQRDTIYVYPKVTTKKEKGNSKETSTSKSSDSVKVSNDSKTDVRKDEKKVVKDKEAKRVPWLAIIVLGVFLCWLVWMLKRK